jgi:hypothetical protein
MKPSMQGCIYLRKGGAMEAFPFIKSTISMEQGRMEAFPFIKVPFPWSIIDSMEIRLLEIFISLPW